MAENSGMARIRYIDGLRAVAVLLVVAHHVMLHSPGLSVPVPFASVAHAMLEGAHGVDLFFVLSGFCLSYPLLRRLHGDGAARFDVIRYFAKRIVRIVPPYYAAIALLLLLPASREGLSAGDLLKQLVFLDWKTTFLNGSFWTLCVEFRWYFFFPIALTLWIRRPRAFWTVACAAVILYGLTRMHAPDVGTLFAFMLGIVAADLEIRAYAAERIAMLLLPVSILTGLLLEQWWSMPSPSGAESAIFFVQTNPGWQLAAFAFVLLTARMSVLRNVLSSAPLAAVGTASYSIYLVHEPIVAFFEQRPHFGLIQDMLLAYAAAVAAGFAFWALFERMWMAGPLKERAVALLEPLLERVANVAGVAAAIPFWNVNATRIASPAPEGESAPA